VRKASCPINLIINFLLSTLKIDTFTDLAADPVYLAAQTINFTANQLGPLTNPVADFLGWDRISDERLAQIGAGVLSSYPRDWPFIEYFSAPGVVGNFDNLWAENAVAGATGARFVTILAGLVAPRSRGSVTIASPDTAVLPIINPGFLSDPVDQAVAIEAFKRTRAAFAAKAMQPILVGPEYIPGNAIQTDAQILDYVRKNAMTIWHASCTCAMRKREYGGVLDSNLQVYGVNGLRVVDASSFPELPPGRE
jgi:choline dehydrogenase